LEEKSFQRRINFKMDTFDGEEHLDGNGMVLQMLHMKVHIAAIEAYVYI